MTSKKDSQTVNDGDYSGDIFLEKELIVQMEDSGDLYDAGQVKMFFSSDSADSAFIDTVTSSITKGLLLAILILLLMSALVHRLILAPLNKIAERIADIAHGHGDLTKRINADSKDETHKLMENGLEKVNLNVESVAQAGISFANIKDAVGQNLIGATAIAAAAEEQTQTLTVIQSNVDQIKAANEQTLTITVNTTGVNEELVELGHHIHQLVAKFKI